MNRDPRFARMQSKDQAAENKSSVQQQPKIADPIRPIVSEDLEKEKEKRILEMDLSIFGELELPSFKENEVDDDEEDRMGLPFKPHRVQPAAKEIDATICSHLPLDYKLRPLALTKPDYSSLVATIPVSRIQQDPRLRRYSKMRPLPLEPEVAAIEAKPSPLLQSTVEKPSDPRRKAAAAASGPSSTPPQLQLRSPEETVQSKPIVATSLMWRTPVPISELMSLWMALPFIPPVIVVKIVRMIILVSRSKIIPRIEISFTGIEISFTRIEISFARIKISFARIKISFMRI